MSSYHRSFTVAPTAFLMPISRVRRSEAKLASPNNPRPATTSVPIATEVDISVNRVSLLYCLSTILIQEAVDECVVGTLGLPPISDPIHRIPD